MSTYIPGEIVDVTVQCARVEAYDEDERLLTVQYGRSHFVVALDLNEATRVRRLRPVAGEPRPGDVWEDRHGGRHFAYGRSTGAVRFCSADGSHNDWTAINEALGPLLLHSRAPEAESEVSA